MLEKDKYNKLPESLKDALALTVRPNWGMFYDNTWSETDKDLETITYEVYQSVLLVWLAGNTWKQ